jgi:hypothetical protein
MKPQKTRKKTQSVGPKLQPRQSPRMYTVTIFLDSYYRETGLIVTQLYWLRSGLVLCHNVASLMIVRSWRMLFFKSYNVSTLPLAGFGVRCGLGATR